jgi:hypothetical protein
LAASRLPNVPRFLGFPVAGFFFLEYSRYCPLLSLRIMPSKSMGRGIIPGRETGAKKKQPGRLLL